MKLWILRWVICCLLWHPISSLPTGPPAAACRDLIPQHPEAVESDLGYVILVQETMEPLETVIVTLFGSQNYRGIFLQVRDGSSLDSSSAVGSWESSVVPNFFRIIDCSNEGFPPGSAFGHASRALKQAAQGFRWTAPDCEDGQRFFVRGTVLQNVTSYQSGFIQPITCSVPTTSNASTPPVSTTTPLTTPAATTQFIAPTTQFIAPTTQFIAPTTQFIAPTTTTPDFGTATSTNPATTMQPVEIETTEPTERSPAPGCRFSAFDNIPQNYTNNFEDPRERLKGWRNLTSRSGGTYRWKLGRGPTPSLATGPTKAYEGLGYIFTEASSPALPGDRAALVTNNDLRGCFCFRFATSFHVRGSGHVLAVEIGGEQLGAITAPFSNWTVSAIQVDTPNFVGIRVMATRGSTWLGDMALDDVQIYPGLC